MEGGNKVVVLRRKEVLFKCTYKSSASRKSFTTNNNLTGFIACNTSSVIIYRDDAAPYTLIIQDRRDVSRKSHQNERSGIALDE